MVDKALVVPLKPIASISRPITQNISCPARMRRQRSTEWKLALIMLMVKATILALTEETDEQPNETRKNGMKDKNRMLKKMTTMLMLMVTIRMTNRTSQSLRARSVPNHSEEDLESIQLDRNVDPHQVADRGDEEAELRKISKFFRLVHADAPAGAKVAKSMTMT